MSPFKFDPEQLIKQRKLAKLSQQEVGDVMGVNKMTICKWEKGQYVPPDRHIKKLAKILNTNPLRLMKMNYEERVRNLGK